MSQSSIDHVITMDMSEVNQIGDNKRSKIISNGMNAIGGVVNTSLIGSPNIRVDKFHQKISIGGESFNKGLYGNSIF